MKDDDAGFTLPELLISMLIFGLIVSAFGAMLSTVLRNATTAQNGIDGNRGESLTDVYFTADVNSLETASTGDASSCVPSGSTVLLNLAWTDPDGYAHHVDYVTRAGGGVTALHRVDCTAGSAHNQVVDHTLDEQVAGSLTSVTCSPACTTTASKPTAISMSVWHATTGGAAYTVAASRRIS